ncbi:MAG: SHOCT domain-containing protein [Gammaproteobacteria bacterium]|jgi:putative membrane protein
MWEQLVAQVGEANLHGWLATILFWLVIILSLIFLIRKMFEGTQLENEEDIQKALELLKERYARGEIDRNEFEQKKHDLEH